MQVPEQVRAAAAGVLGHQMAAGLEQAAALDRKQRGAADRQLGAELLGGEPGVGVGHGSGGCRGGGSPTGYPERWAVLPEASADPQNFRNSRRTLRGSPNGFDSSGGWQGWPTPGRAPLKLARLRESCDGSVAVGDGAVPFLVQAAL